MPNAETKQEKAQVRLGLAIKDLEKALEWAEFSIEIYGVEENHAIANKIKDLIKEANDKVKEMHKHIPK